MELNGEYHTPSTLLLGRKPGTPWIKAGWAPEPFQTFQTRDISFLYMVISVLYKYTASTFSAEMSQVGNTVSFTDVQVMKWVTENEKTWPIQASVDCKY